MKIFALIGALLIALALASCGGKSSSDQNTNDQTSASAGQESGGQGSAGQGSGDSTKTSVTTKEGGGGGSGASQKPPRVIKVSAKLPAISIPAGPPPGHLVVKDIKVGTGPLIRPRAEISTRYVAVSYRTGKAAEVKWTHPFNLQFSPGLEIKGWEIGLKGMKVGGRRELIIPPKLAYETETLVYVIDLLSVK